MLGSQNNIDIADQPTSHFAVSAQVTFPRSHISSVVCMPVIGLSIKGGTSTFGYNVKTPFLRRRHHDHYPFSIHILKRISLITPLFTFKLRHLYPSSYVST